ncbi:MAG: hypothetical protein LLG14_05710 [Nocardiaceae bacterium]|nr:hypothetical protein [Nocardiaceae bacterium]
MRWVADGCPYRDWPNEAHKITARALASRELLSIRWPNKVWTAELAAAGKFYVEIGQFPVPRRRRSMSAARDNREDVFASDDSVGAWDRFPLDATARAMRRVKAKSKTTEIKQTKRVINETYMRYKVVVSRVQVAERFVRATSEGDVRAPGLEVVGDRRPAGEGPGVSLPALERSACAAAPLRVITQFDAHFGVPGSPTINIATDDRTMADHGIAVWVCGRSSQFTVRLYGWGFATP